MLSSSTAIVLGFIWQLFKLQIALRRSSFSTPHHYSREVLHRSPKRCESLEEALKVLDLPELKIAIPSSDTRWLTHEKYVTTVKRCYYGIVTTLEKIMRTLMSLKPCDQRNLNKVFYIVRHLTSWRCSSTGLEVELVSLVREIGFDCHLKSCGCHSTHSRRCPPACSILAVGTTRGWRWNGNNSRHQVYLCRQQ